MCKALFFNNPQIYLLPILLQGIREVQICSFDIFPYWRYFWGIEWLHLMTKRMINLLWISLLRPKWTDQMRSISITDSVIFSTCHHLIKLLFMIFFDYYPLIIKNLWIKCLMPFNLLGRNNIWLNSLNMILSTISDE